MLRWLGKKKLSRDDVVTAYRSLLGREPENETVIEKYREMTAARLIQDFTNSLEFQKNRHDSPYYYYSSVVNVPATIRAHEDPKRTTKPGHIVNFFGVATDVKFIPVMWHMAGHLEPEPIPANWHADMAEFAAALHAVELAKGRFTMIELGCGWGCWMNNTGVAARRRGLKLHLIGVEGDEGHLGFAREALATNGITPDQYTLFHGIAGAQTGAALFPIQSQSGEDWGLEPKFGLDAAERAKLLKKGQYSELPVLALGDVVGDEPRIDLLHMDIQGGEADFVRDCMATLIEKVAYLVIGTHSRAIEGRLITDLLAAGWVLEVERSCDFGITPNGLQTTVDGIQGWRNPRLIPL